MRCKRKNIPSSLRMKFNALKHVDGSFDQIAENIRISSAGQENSCLTDFNSWYEESLFSSRPVEFNKKPLDFEKNRPLFFCFATESNFSHHLAAPENRKLPPLPPDRTLGSSGGWMNKWKNRTVVKFTRLSGKQPVGEDMADVVRKVGKRSKHAEEILDKTKFARGVQLLLMALEYIERQERFSQQLLADGSEIPLVQPEIMRSSRTSQ